VERLEKGSYAIAKIDKVMEYLQQHFSRNVLAQRMLKTIENVVRRSLGISEMAPEGSAESEKDEDARGVSLIEQL